MFHRLRCRFSCTGQMKQSYLPVCLLLIFAIMPSGLIADDVLQHHLNATRDGLYVDGLITQQAAKTIRRDTTFSAPLPGPTYAQPLYVAGGPQGRPALIVATEQNTVLALDAVDGSRIWVRNLGNPVRRSQLPCGNIDPVGVTGTPVIDSKDRIIYVAAMTTPDNGVTKQHRIFALSLDDGSTLPGWPLESSGIRYKGLSFNSTVQNQRGALLLNSGFLYVPYGGNAGDCGSYHGWVVAVPVDNPAKATAWATEAPSGGGIWASAGLSTDGNLIFAATGNTFNANTWMGGEAIIRLGSGATFSENSADFFTPSNWRALDASDSDVGGSGPILVDVPGATPSQLVVALGKDGMVYLLDRNQLGGIGTGNGTNAEGVYSKRVSQGAIITSAAAYTAASGSYVVFNTTGSGIGCPGTPGNLVALKIGPSSPPTVAVAWCANNGGSGSPIVTTTDGTSEPVVWSVGSESSNRLHAFNGETGEVLFSGGGADEEMGIVRRFQTPIAVNGRIFVAGDNELYAFAMRDFTPTVSATPSAGSGTSQEFTFTFSKVSNPASVNVVIHSSLTAGGACYFIYQPPSDQFDLIDDAGTALMQLNPGSSDTLANSQCSIPGSSVSVSATSDTVTITATVTFTAAFAGEKTIWATWYRDDTRQTDWQSIGSWTVQ
jgi:hypothetical protein